MHVLIYIRIIIETQSGNIKLIDVEGNINARNNIVILNTIFCVLRRGFFFKITITCLPMTMHRLVKGYIANNNTITTVFEFNNM